MLEISAFYGLGKPRVLNLTTSKLLITKEEFHPDLFKPLKKLQGLYLDDNLVNDNSSYLDETIGK